jgi:hypothetical protein|tara:strand:+ start:357 stop:1100 length:744 start_codon:yes stop_codon:yes gene_type:complete
MIKVENKKEIIDNLRDDNNYYGEYGKQFISNSDIKTLMTNPLDLRNPQETHPYFLIGGYFHTAILEPDKIKQFKIVDASTRNTKAYKEISGGEVCLLQHEVDKTEALVEKMLNNTVCRDLIHTEGNDFELPGVAFLEGNWWKGKADIVNHEEKLVVDLKTTGDLEKFHWSAKKYNYDSQAYIYRELFGYDMLFVAIDKNTQQIGIYDCSDQFYNEGKEKVEKASEIYDLFFKNKDFDPNNYFINRTL